MSKTVRIFVRTAALTVAGGLFALYAAAHTARADEPSNADDIKASVPDDKVPSYNLLDAAKQGLVTVKAEGLGDGRMTLSVHNRTKKELRVVLPPGLIASGASGQFGGMGGMGGGMGGMGGGGMGGGMGGMGGGMGGMGGGMGGMGGGMGGMGGGMGGGGMGGGGMMGGGVMPASMGMMMLGRLIMSLVGDRDSWDQRSLMMGMMGGMGGGMGGMGGGMGGMGGMGGGMRSIPPTGLPFANLKADQTRNLPTRLASLSAGNGEDGRVTVPGKGERLRIGDIRESNMDQRVLTALTRLARDKAPESVATMVLWNVASGLTWEAIAEKSKGWANEHELSLAKSFVDQLADLPRGETGALLFEIKGEGATSAALASDLTALLKDHPVLGLKAKAGVPARPDAPAVACRIVVDGSGARPEATVFVATTDASAANWVAAGKFTLPVAIDGGKPKAVAFADALAEGLLGRLLRAQLSKAGVVKGKAVYKVRIDNASPLILNGLAILGVGEGKAERTPKVLAGISVSPHKSMTVPATAEMVDQLGLRKGVRVIAADLSGL